MNFTSLGFLGLVAAIVLLSNAFPAPRARAALLLAASSVFVMSHVDSALQLVPLAAFLLFGYLNIELLRRTRSARLLAGSLVLTLAAFVVLKRYGFVEGLFTLPFPYLVVGLSYVLFRVLHLMIDAQQGDLTQRVPLLGFLGYGINFLTFSAGPVQSYRDFAAAQAQPLALDEARVRGALARIVKGFVKVGVVSALLSYLFDRLSAQLLGGSSTGGARLVVSYGLTATVYTAHLYANFAGYMDIVIGVGLLIGLRLPENFERPFTARNFLDFWSRWHMTLSSWFKTYLFNPLLKTLTARYDSAQRAPYLAAVGFFVTFLVMGLWHGSTSVFVVYGLLLGAGASINKGWQVWAGKRLGKKAYRELCERPSIAYSCRGLTFAYFALALTCLWVDLAQLERLLQRLGPLGVTLSYMVLAGGAALVFRGVDGLVAFAGKASTKLTAGRAMPLVHDFGLAAQILLVLSVGSFFHKAPEFVYRAF